MVQMAKRTKHIQSSERRSPRETDRQTHLGKSKAAALKDNLKEEAMLCKSFDVKPIAY